MADGYRCNFNYSIFLDFKRYYYGKQKHNHNITLSLVPFMKSDLDIEKVILNVAFAISNLRYVNDDLNQFIRGIELIIADKFVETKVIKKTIANLLGGNMQIIEEYAKDYAENHTKEIIIRMFNEGLSKEDIARFTGLDLSFVNETLSK